MRLSSHPSQTHRADLDALDCVLGLLEAARHHDADAYRASLHDDLVVRADGAIVALGADAGTSVEVEQWIQRRGQLVEVVDVSVVSPIVYVRYRVHEPHRDGEAPRPTALGYSVYEVDGRRLLAASHFYRELTVPPPVPALLEAPLSPEPEPEPEFGPILDAPPAIPAPRPVLRRWAMPVVGIASWLAQDAILAAPVVIATARYGGVPAFTVLAAVYFTASVVASLLTLRLLARSDDDHPSRIAAWLDRVTQHGAGLRALRAGGFVGFIVGSYFMSAAPTVWALHELGVRRRLPLLAVVASVIWAAGFVGFYAGATTILGI